MSSSPRSAIADIPRSVFWVALAFSAFQIYMAAFHPLSSLVIRAIHVGFVVLLIFMLEPAATSRGGRFFSWALGGIAFVLSLYHWVFESDLTARAGMLTPTDTLVGVVLLILVFEAARRMMGWALPFICGLFLLYGLFGEYLPGMLQHRGYGFDQIIGTLSFGTEGIYGTPTYVSSTYIFLFILFGAFLEQAGMITLFTNFAMGMVGHTRGGPAKVSVISSGFMGTINGSGVANVVTTGQFTIPLMKRFGYAPAFAGGVEATSSMGGQIMPPVMGAVAFIMAETLNVPYIDICKAALIPALLYFVTIFWTVHLEAGRKGLHGLDKKDCPDPWAALKERWYLLLPLLGLVALLFSGYTPMFSGTIGLALTVVLIFGAAIVQGLSRQSMRYLFWVLLAFACGGFLEFGVITFFVVTAMLVALLLISKKETNALRLAVEALVMGARHALPVAIACALVGVIIGIINLTGVATTLGGYIISIGQGNLFLALLLTMLTCLILGMGIPTIPNYILTSSLAAPILLELGVPLIVSHMFVFYFGIMADLTPPVALACFAASPIAKAPGLQISVQALRVAVAGFIMPYMAVYAPALMLQGDGGATAVMYIVVKALLAIGLWGAGAIGYLFGPLGWLSRVIAIAAATLLVVAAPITDEIGIALCVGFIIWHAWRHPEKRMHPESE
ncbi:TRAP transporter permease [Neopusillimonas maritima]|uniref:C4-dicarboxylate ABC transporter n=1 Tax=Neopusillimonas maritima TaxID=2026239 RepID=A0ABX9MZH5_9BURK|nr:TRAP transporter permease [Neopusillimonas maritima]RII83931.1 C4-dicarboxylate ABC transporter [Neopusillimonas maritima]